MTFYTMRELAEMLKVSEQTIRRLIDAGKLIANQIAGLRRVSDADLANYLAATKTTGPAPVQESAPKVTRRGRRKIWFP